jgi:hypothetical protein
MNQLSTQQQAGLLFGCLAFGARYWSNAVTGLNSMAKRDRGPVLDLFKAFGAKVYGKDIARWLFENWSSMEPWYFDLIEYLKRNSIQESYSILLLALVVQSNDIKTFVNYVLEFRKLRSASTLLEFAAREKPSKLQFVDFVGLTDVLMQDSNAFAIEKCKEELMGASLENWVGLIEKSAATIHLSDKGSIQEAIDEFIRAYGPIDETFSKNLFVTGSSLGFLLHETPNKPNFK